METTQSTIVCPTCGEVVARKSPRQVGCGAASCRYARKWQKVKADPAYEEHRRRANQRAKEWYEQNKQWHAATRRARKQGIREFLPGAMVTIEIEPAPKWPIEHRNVRALHGAMSEIIGRDHDPQIPGFALIPCTKTWMWSAYLRNGEDIEKVASKTHRVTLFEHERDVRIGRPHLCPSPKWPTEGQAIRMATITPVVIRQNGRGARSTHIEATGDSLMSALGPAYQERLQAPGLEPQVVVRSRRTRPVTVPILGKYGMIAGWVGEVVLDVNPAAAWLLQCAAWVGLGGRTALGFGRIRLEDVIEEGA